MSFIYLKISVLAIVLVYFIQMSVQNEVDRFPPKISHFDHMNRVESYDLDRQSSKYEDFSVTIIEGGKEILSVYNPQIITLYADALLKVEVYHDTIETVHLSSMRVTRGLDLKTNVNSKDYSFNFSDYACNPEHSKYATGIKVSMRLIDEYHSIYFAVQAAEFNLDPICK